MFRLRNCWRGFALLLALWLVGTTPGRAQFHRATGPVMLPASALLLQDDAFAAEVNPALVGLLPAFSAAYLHSEVDRSQSFRTRGDALHLATPLPFGFAAALSLHSLRPGERASIRAARALTAATLSFSPSARASIGLTTRTLFSQDARFDGLTSFDVGAVFRLSPVLQASIAARDLFISRSGFGVTGLYAAPACLSGLQVRPFGTSQLILDGSVAVDTRDNFGLRLGASVAVPLVGQLSAVGEFEWPDEGDHQWSLLAELSMSLDQLSAGAGWLSGPGYGSAFHGYGFVRVDGRLRQGLTLDPQGDVLDLELKALTPRSFLATAQVLDRALHDPAIAGVLLRPRGSKIGMALAQELRLQLAALKKAGKFVGCHLENASGSEYYLCAAGEQVLIDPAGSIRLAGHTAHVMLFGDALKKIHVRAEFMRIGDQKSAPEQFTRRLMSEPAREQTNALLDDAQRRMQEDLSHDLDKTPREVAELLERGPYLAESGVAAGLVAASVDSSELGQSGDGAKIAALGLTASLPARHPRGFGVASRIGVVLVDGTIVDGESVDVPLIGLHSTGGTTVVKAIDGLAADPTVRAIVVRIDSPGGAVLASDQIWRALYRARKRKPVIASMGAVAASGGYYVASAAHEIWADPSTVTGSIGIFYGKVDLSELADRLGVGVEVLTRGKHAGAESMFTSLTTADRAMLADRLRTYYRKFLERVAAGRGMTVSEVDARGRGRVFSGDAAQRLKLVDHLGGVSAAIARARRLAYLSEDAEVTVVPSTGGLLSLLTQGAVGPATLPSTASLPLSEAVRRALASWFALQSLQDGAPMALLPYDIVL